MLDTTNLGVSATVIQAMINVVSAMAVVFGTGLSVTVSAQPAGDDLARLTVVPTALPANCRLNPNPGGFQPTNPAIVTNPAILGFMHSVIFPSGETTAPPTSGRAKLFVGSASARAAAVEVGYAASYQEAGGSPEIGVFALRLKDPSATPAVTPTVPSAKRITSGPVVIFSWSDATPGAPDLGCLDVVRRHIERVEFK
jgi:hypothetical protein